MENNSVIQVYKFSDTRCLYERSNECNPYILIEHINKRILVEVVKEYVKENNLVFYFLANDLSDCERDFFENCMIELNCDYVYNFTNIEKNKGHKKIFKRKYRKIKQH